MKNDVRDHAVIPLARNQRFYFLPRPIPVKFRKAERNKGGVPIPLIRIKPMRRHGVAATVIADQDVACLCVQVGHWGDPLTAIIRMSFTLVRVGPVMIKPPSDLKRS